MEHTKKTLIAGFTAAVFAVTCSQVFGWEVSGCGGCGGTYFYSCADRFCDKVDSFPGWSQAFCLGCSSCSEDYYKRAASGGSENSWIDSTDIHFRNSHCGLAWDSLWGKNLSAIPFTDGSVTPGEAYRAWGDYDLEWVACKCCSLLRDSSRGYWYTAFDGLHLMLGYKTSSYGYTNFGRIFAKKMKKTTILWWTIPGQTVTQAWFNTTDQTQPSGTTARVLAEVYDNYNDHLWGNGYVSPDPSYNGWYWYWDHVAGSPEYLQASALEVMNVYEVVPRTIDEQYAQTIGAAFGLEGQVADTCNALVMADLSDPANPKVLQISKESGIYYYQNHGKLFAANPNAGFYPPEEAPDKVIPFLQEYRLLPADAGDYTAETDYLVEESQEGVVRQRLQQNTNVVFARQIPADPEDQHLVSVAGAGARLKMYIAADSEIMGGMGNWRQIREAGTVQVNDSAKTWEYFGRYGHALSPAKAQVQYDEAIPLMQEATQGYYEHPGGVVQKELIPCWIIPVQYYQEGELVLKADTFIPASEGYFPPLATITLPTHGDTFKQGTTVEFDCQVETGFATPPYSFKWESSVDGPLSTQQSFSTNLLSVHCSDRSCDCAPLPHTIRVTVTDAKGSESSDEIQITILGACDECIDCSDLNKDNVTNFEDFAIIADHWLHQSVPGAE